MSDTKLSVDTEAFEAVVGSWPRDCQQRAFVAGAMWWQFRTSGATGWPSERDEAEAEAVRRYGDPCSASKP